MFEVLLMFCLLFAGISQLLPTGSSLRHKKGSKLTSHLREKRKGQTTADNLRLFAGRSRGDFSKKRTVHKNHPGRFTVCSRNRVNSSAGIGFAK